MTSPLLAGPTVLDQLRPMKETTKLKVVVVRPPDNVHPISTLDRTTGSESQSETETETVTVTETETGFGKENVEEDEKPQELVIMGMEIEVRGEEGMRGMVSGRGRRRELQNERGMKGVQGGATGMTGYVDRLPDHE